MKAIGGYFQLELNRNGSYHERAIKLNAARNALRYILEARQYRKVYLPMFSCEVLLEPIAGLGLKFEYYFIDDKFEPKFDFSRIAADECFLYINYFGLKWEYVAALSDFCRNLIIDNAQAFFARPIGNGDVFYSPRKFFGAPDGGYLYTDKLLDRELLRDVSCDRAAHLLVRSDLTAEDGYEIFAENEKKISDADLRLMSNLTDNILRNADYGQAAARRVENFLFLENELRDLNPIHFALGEDQVPLCYPFYSRDRELRKRLRADRIYTAQYWASVLENAPPESVERDYTENLIHLPIDQRVETEDLKRIIKTIKL